MWTGSASTGLYRAECLSDPEEALASIDADRRHEYGIVRISAAFLKSLQLTVQCSPNEQIKGHVVIPELNSDAYQADKARFTPVKSKLAAEASKEENIVRQPQ